LDTYLLTNHHNHVEEVDSDSHVEVIFDTNPFEGPLHCMEQIFSSFKKTTKNILIIPVDMPNLNTKLIYSLLKSWEENQNFAVISHDGIFAQPLFGIYPLNEENHFKLKKNYPLGIKIFSDGLIKFPINISMQKMEI